MALPQLPPRLLMAVAIGDLSYVKKFVGEGDNINQTGDFGVTPLLAAIEGGHTDIVKYLLEKGAAIPPADELPASMSPSIQRLIDSRRNWKADSRNLAEFSAAAEHPSLSTPSSPITKLNRDVVGNIASYLRPSGTPPIRGRSKTAGKSRRLRKQTRRRR